MKYIAMLEKLNPNIEEEVTISINEIMLTGFATICPYIIEVGKQYLVKLGLTILNEIEINEIDEPIFKFENVGESYAYFIRGKLCRDKLDAGILIEDDFFLDYAYLDGKFIELYVDRISVEFL